ncbi:MAG: TM2 domain-containing protein [Candidatus Aminicenantes bacterium]|nr:TM2 domain-containing protein [Candidatus Aminicenantes bacterium]
MEEKVVVTRQPKSPALAGILSFFFPFGVGAFYNSQPIKGFIYLLLFAALVTMQSNGEVQPFVGILLGGFYIYQIIESINTSKSINRRALTGEEVEKEKEELPEFVKTGSVFWGIVLLALGVILLLANFDVISYETVFDFWPVAIIVVGVKLVADYVVKKNGSRS